MTPPSVEEEEDLHDSAVASSSDCLLPERIRTNGWREAVFDKAMAQVRPIPEDAPVMRMTLCCWLMVEMRLVGCPCWCLSVVVGLVWRCAGRERKV